MFFHNDTERDFYQHFVDKLGEELTWQLIYIMRLSEEQRDKAVYIISTGLDMLAAIANLYPEMGKN